MDEEELAVALDHLRTTIPLPTIYVQGISWRDYDRGVSTTFVPPPPEFPSLKEIAIRALPREIKQLQFTLTLRSLHFDMSIPINVWPWHTGRDIETVIHQNHRYLPQSLGPDVPFVFVASGKRFFDSITTTRLRKQILDGEYDDVIKGFFRSPDWDPTTPLSDTRGDEVLERYNAAAEKARAMNYKSLEDVGITTAQTIHFVIPVDFMVRDVTSSGAFTLVF